MKDSPSKSSKIVEEPAYSPLPQRLLLRLRGIEAQAQPTEPSSGERSRFLVVLTLIVHSDGIDIELQTDQALCIATSHGHSGLPYLY